MQTTLSRTASAWLVKTLLVVLFLTFGAEGFSLSSDNIWRRKSKKKQKPSPQASSELARIDESLNRGKIANEKIILEQVIDSPDPFNITEHQQTTLTGKFKIRYTDTLASEGKAAASPALMRGNGADKFDFIVRHHWSITNDATGLKVKELVGETAVVLLEQRRHQYFQVDVYQVWTGLDANNQPVADGRYTYSCYGELIRTKVATTDGHRETQIDTDKDEKENKGKGKGGSNDNGQNGNNKDKPEKGKAKRSEVPTDVGSKTKLVGVSNTLAGTLTVISVQPDTTPPVITSLNPANGSILAQ
ncbi:MAG: hypothetical protein HY762_01530, partial [Planctomycetes bacterium]|nr:hypothetical protein [Planctomycetota bacterium]